MKMVNKVIKLIKQIGKDLTRRNNGLFREAKKIISPSQAKAYSAICKEAQVEISSLGERVSLLGELMQDKRIQTFLQDQFTS